MKQTNDEKILGADAAEVATAGSIAPASAIARHTDNPSAFPELKTFTRFDDDLGKYVDYYAPHGGMSLRDYFAAKAMQAHIATGKWNNRDADHVAEMSFIHADAMLAERIK